MYTNLWGTHYDRESKQKPTQEKCFTHLSLIKTFQQQFFFNQSDFLLFFVTIHNHTKSQKNRSNLVTRTNRNAVNQLNRFYASLSSVSKLFKKVDLTLVKKKKNKYSRIYLIFYLLINLKDIKLAITCFKKYTCYIKNTKHPDLGHGTNF